MNAHNLKSPLAIAPMIDWSYPHFRVLMRLLAPGSLLYTEMQTLGAVENNPQKSLDYYPMEHPLALQLGGSDANALARCAQQAEALGFDEVNLNLGCPSDKVQAGRFGACLMSEPELVKDCIRKMKESINVTLSAKTRIGIDEQDSYDYFADFAHALVEAGCDKLIVHARKAWLHGLNPKQNRNIPPLHYDYVYRIKQAFPHLPIVINGNISHIEQIQQHLEWVDGVMLGRLACQNPYAIAAIDQKIWRKNPLKPRSEYMKKYFQHIQAAYEQGANIHLLTKPIFNFAHGMPQAQRWKQILMEVTQRKDMSLLAKAMDHLLAIETNYTPDTLEFH